MIRTYISSECVFLYIFSALTFITFFRANNNATNAYEYDIKIKDKAERSPATPHVTIGHKQKNFDDSKI